MAGQLVTVQDLTSGVFSPRALFDLVWALNYQGRYQYNRSPWVERGLAEAVESVQLLPKGALPPKGAWHIELLDTSDQEGALGYHEDEAFQKNTPGTRPEKASGRSSRGVALHPETQELIPLAKVFCKTSREDGVESSEVASHELLEMLVDPRVVNENEVRKYLNSERREWFIGEVCDPVQERGYDVGGPEGRSTGVVVADFVYPAWFGQPQTRQFTSFAEEALSVHDRVEPWALAPGGYMSVAPEGEPSNWSQVFGSAHQQ